MNGKKDRSIRKRRGKNIQAKNNTLRNHKKKHGKTPNKRNKRSNKRKTISKNQKGGSILASLGLGMAATAVTAAAYKGYRMISRLSDKGYMFRLLNQEYISYAPKVIVVETPDFMKHYLECISTVEFFQILLSNREYLKSKTLQSLIKDSTKEEKISKNRLSNQYGEEYKELEELLDYTDYKNKNILDSIELEASALELDTNNENIKKLRDLLLLTAKIPGSSLDDNTESNQPEFQELIRLDRINPYLTVSTFRWQDVIYSGIYDEYFTSEVEDILRERNSEFLTRDNEKERLQKIINHLSRDPKFIEGIRRKMIECSSKPRGYLDYISSSISWDSQKQCLACPSQECLLYVYDFYQGFLEQEDDVLLIDKLYSLMICEARICVLSKCLALEAIRIQESNYDKVRYLINEIYKQDMKSPTGKSLELPNKLIPFSNQLGGAEPFQTTGTQGQPITNQSTIQSTTPPSVDGGNEPEESSSVGDFISSLNPFADDPEEQAQPSTSQPPTAQPPTAQPPTAQPPTAQPPIAQPPIAQPPITQQPIAQQPIEQQPIEQQPIAQQPIAQQPNLQSSIEQGLSPQETMTQVTQPIPIGEQEPQEPIDIEVTVENEQPREIDTNDTSMMQGEDDFQKGTVQDSEIGDYTQEYVGKQDQGETSDVSDSASELPDPIIETHLLSMITELKKQIPLNKSRNELFDILGLDISEQGDVIEKFMNYNVGDNFKLKDIFINVFREYSSEDAIEEKNTAIQALFNIIKEYGMIFVDCFSLEFLLSAGNLFDKDIAYNDVVGLSDTISKLYLDGEIKRASIMVIVLLKLADDPNRLYIIKSFFERVEGIRYENTSLVSMLLSSTVNLLTRANKNKAGMLQRVAHVYNSASKENRVDVHTFSIWPYLSESETKLFEIPNHDISNYDTPNTDIYSRYEPLSQDCSQNVDEIKEMIRKSGPFSVNAAMINNLERCRPKEIRNKK